MARPQTPAGEMGKISVTRLENGRFQARGATRDDSGALQRLRASGDTEEAAREALQRKATRLSTGGGTGLTPDNTIAEGVESWLEQVHTRAKAGSISFSTYESYETAARMILVPRFGAVRFEQLTVGRCDRMLQDILATETLSKARRARTVLGLLCGYAVRDDALPRSPVRDVQRLPMRLQHSQPGQHAQTTTSSRIGRACESSTTSRRSGASPTSGVAEFPSPIARPSRAVHDGELPPGPRPAPRPLPHVGRRASAGRREPG